MLAFNLVRLEEKVGTQKFPNRPRKDVRGIRQSSDVTRFGIPLRGETSASQSASGPQPVYQGE